MTSHRTRMRRATSITVLVGLVATILAAAGAGESAEQRAQQRAADAAVSGFSRSLATFDARQSKTLKTVVKDDVDDYTRLLKTVQRAVKVAPTVPRRGTTAYGRQHSDAYAEAVRERDSIVGPYVSLVTLLRTRAIPASRFIVAGRAAVGVDPGELLDGVLVITGQTLRERVVPPFKKARTRLQKQDVPQGAELLARDLRAFLDFAIRQTRDGADRIDEGKPFYFDFASQPQDLSVRLTTLEAQIAREVAVLTVGISSGA